MTTLVESASALLIGDELLSGKTREANLEPLATTLRALGIALRHAAVVGDNEVEIVDELNRQRERYDLVITSGGVGPTHDDITLIAVAQAFGVPTHEHPVLAEMLRRHYKDELTEAHLRMALVPKGADLVSSKEVRWPTVRMENVWIFPGVPELFRMKLVVLRELVRGRRQFVTRAAFVEEDELEIKLALDAIVAGHPAVQVGSYPKFMDKRYKTKVTFDGDNDASVRDALTDFCNRVRPGKVAWTE